MFKVAEFLIYAALRDALVNSGASEEVLFWFDSIDDGPLKGKTFSEFKKNPQISVQDLSEVYKKLKSEEEEKKKKKQENVEKQFPKSVIEAMSFAKIPQIKQWIKNVVFKKNKNDLSSYSSEVLKNNIEKIENWINSVDKEELRNLQVANFNFDQMLAFVEKMESDKEEAQKESERFGFKQVFYGPDWQNSEFDGFKIVELDKKSQLVYESDNLYHCVGQSDNYINKIKDGESRIFSLRDSSNKPLVTIETSPDLWVFKQSFGRENSQPNSIETSMLNEWKRSLRTDEQLVEKAGGNKDDQVQVAQFVSRGNNDEIIDELLKSDDVGSESIGSAISNKPRSVLQALAQNDKLNEVDYEKIYEKSKKSKTINFSLVRNPAISDDLFKEIFDSVFMGSSRGNSPEIVQGAASSFKVNSLDDKRLNEIASQSQKALMTLLNNPTFKSEKARRIIKENNSGDEKRVDSYIKYENKNFDPKFMNDYFSVEGYEKWTSLANQIDSFKDEDLKEISKITGVPFNKNLKDDFINKLLIQTLANKDPLLKNANLITRTVVKRIGEGKFSKRDMIKLSTLNVSSITNAILDLENISVDVLDSIIESSSDPYISRIAINRPNMTVESLIKHYNNQNENIKAIVASNPKTPVEILEELSTNPKRTVRMDVASNKSTTPEILEKMYVTAKENKDDILIGRVIENENTPMPYILDGIKDSSTRNSYFYDLVYKEGKEDIDKEIANHGLGLSIDGLKEVKPENAQGREDYRTISYIVESGAASFENYKRLFDEMYKYSELISNFLTEDSYKNDERIKDYAIFKALEFFKKTGDDNDNWLPISDTWYSEIAELKNLTEEDKLKIIKNFPSRIANRVVANQLKNGPLSENLLKTIKQRGNEVLFLGVVSHGYKYLKDYPDWFLVDLFKDKIFSNLGQRLTVEVVNSVSENLAEKLSEDPKISSYLIKRFPNNDKIAENFINNNQKTSSIMKSIREIIENEMLVGGSDKYNNLVMKLISSPRVKKSKTSLYHLAEDLGGLSNNANILSLPEEFYSMLYDSINKEKDQDKKAGKFDNKYFEDSDSFIAAHTSDYNKQEEFFKNGGKAASSVVTNPHFSDEILKKYLKEGTVQQKFLIITSRQLDSETIMEILPQIEPEMLSVLVSNQKNFPLEGVDVVLDRAVDENIDITDGATHKIEKMQHAAQEPKEASIFVKLLKTSYLYEKIITKGKI